ncbi:MULTISPECIES: hypothetical protein [unclassified Prochlorococcus]|uniref:hypothetical protein n=1 Tax=unclassified Prochlorococcus TaxID=2627481 RepID=UPI0012691D4C|nr:MULTISPECIES: hypothetical protein [unclassified Prochlorococcus]
MAKGPLSQDEIFKYLVYFLFLFWIASIWASGGNYTPPISKWITYPAVLIADLLEVFASYRFNGGRYGNDFLGRYFPIKLLTTLRLFIFSWLILSLIILPLSWDTIDSIGGEDVFVELLKTKPLYEIIFTYSYLVFWRLILPLRIIFHMRSIRKNEINN